LTTSSERKGGGKPFVTHSAEETEALAAKLGELLEGGSCVLLSGELGAGKTTFIRGLARGLGVDDPGAVNSPSYTLVNRYPGKTALTHVDAYFMRAAEDLELCGLEDALAAGDVAAVEWADRLFGLVVDPARAPRGAVRVVLEHSGEEKRKITIENWPESRGG
jgi:tRNA threonylcarbamoyladenosine biosynthesis protein TsaE